MLVLALLATAPAWKDWRSPTALTQWRPLDGLKHRRPPAWTHWRPLNARRSLADGATTAARGGCVDPLGALEALGRGEWLADPSRLLSPLATAEIAHTLATLNSSTQYELFVLIVDEMPAVNPEHLGLAPAPWPPPQTTPCTSEHLPELAL